MVDGADARAVHPYMHSSSSFNHSFYTLIRTMWVCRDYGSYVRPAWLTNKQVIGVDELHAARHVGKHGPCVRARGIEGKYTEALERTHEPCVPTCIRMERSVAPVDYQRLETCVPILAISHGNPSHFTAQYNPYCTVKWVRLERHRADFETSHASCWFSTPILLRINHLHSMF